MKVTLQRYRVRNSDRFIVLARKELDWGGHWLHQSAILYSWAKTTLRGPVPRVLRAGGCLRPPGRWLRVMAEVRATASVRGAKVKSENHSSSPVYACIVSEQDQKGPYSINDGRAEKDIQTKTRRRRVRFYLAPQIRPSLHNAHRLGFAHSRWVLALCHSCLFDPPLHPPYGPSSVYSPFSRSER